MNSLLLYPSLTNRESLFANGRRQPAPPSVPPPVSSFWPPSGGPIHQTHLHDMEYHQFAVAQPTHTMTSPPNTPMTPHVGGGGFPGLMCPIDHHSSATPTGTIGLHQKYVHTYNTGV